MCEDFWNNLKIFIKNIMNPEIHYELWDEIGPI
jgi:hypothetical protein